jgi:cell division protein FtsA
VTVSRGASLLPGMPELGEQVLDLPVRRGEPCGVSGFVDSSSGPRYATGVGLALHAFQCDARPRSSGAGLFTKFFTGARRWIEELV